MSVEPKIRIVRTRIPKTCVCPFCKQKQRFKLNGKYFKIVKDMNFKESIKLKVEVLRAKCLNPACGKKIFYHSAQRHRKISKGNREINQ